MTAPKCENCKFYRYAITSDGHNQCLAPQGRNMVGSDLLDHSNFASQMRAWEEKCGPEGRWFIAGSPSYEHVVFLWVLIPAAVMIVAIFDLLRP